MNNENIYSQTSPQLSPPSTEAPAVINESTVRPPCKPHFSLYFILAFFGYFITIFTAPKIGLYGFVPTLIISLCLGGRKYWWHSLVSTFFAHIYAAPLVPPGIVITVFLLFLLHS